ncbi:MAG: hypothetical protein ABFD07_04740 [Methanobacterium sp.]
MIKVEKDLYPFVETFLKQKRGCFGDYVGNELSLGVDTKMRADVFGVSKVNEENTVYLLEGKLRLESRIQFSKVFCEVIPLLDYADYVYIFGIPDDENFKGRNKKYVEICKLLGIGILVLNENGDVTEYLKPKRNVIEKFDKKELLFRIFLKKITRSPIANIIFQSTYEYIHLNHNVNHCAQFIEIYDALFSDKEYKNILDKVLSGKYVLNENGMRKAFQNEFSKSGYIKIQRMNRNIDDYICITEKGLKEVKEPILLD